MSHRHHTPAKSCSSWTSLCLLHNHMQIFLPAWVTSNRQTELSTTQRGLFEVDNFRWPSRNDRASGCTLLSHTKFLLFSWVTLTSQPLYQISVLNGSPPFCSPRHTSRPYFLPFLAKGGKQNDYFSKGILSTRKEQIKVSAPEYTTLPKWTVNGEETGDST